MLHICGGADLCRSVKERKKYRGRAVSSIRMDLVHQLDRGRVWRNRRICLRMGSFMLRGCEKARVVRWSLPLGFESWVFWITGYGVVPVRSFCSLGVRLR